VDQHHTALLGGERPGKPDRRPLPQQLALARLEMAAENAHQGGLARAVLADHRMDAAGFERQRYPVQHLDRAEIFRDALGLQDRHHEAMSQTEVNAPITLGAPGDTGERRRAKDRRSTAREPDRHDNPPNFLFREPR
jgi:hypothetical protein